MTMIYNKTCPAARSIIKAYSAQAVLLIGQLGILFQRDPIIFSGD
jgi:hypothetical protein